ncbi:MAG: PAS domain-containing protein, partial [Campylobacterota bacterium]|nr:PAS domain-containing protein [Campylobacterota bacterium]
MMGLEILILNLILFFIMLFIIIYLKNKLNYTINQSEITQKKLEKEKRKLDEMLSIIPVPILITNNKTRKIVFANKYSSIQYNISQEELIGMYISELYTSDNQAQNILNAM